MFTPMLPSQKPQPRNYLRLIIWTGTLLCTIGGAAFIALLTQKAVALNNTETVAVSSDTTLPPLPIGVDPVAKLIEENPDVESYMSAFVASNHTKPSIADSWFERALAKLTEHDWYQNLATPATRILIIQSGERHEEIAKNFARILRWNADENTIFTERLMDEVPAVKDGKLYPGRYIVTSDAGPEEVAVAVADRFNAEVRTRYTDDVAETLPLKDALIIASLIEREAYDFDDMRYISGVIWNRLFIDMKLQIDATLQYARGEQSAAAGGRWWPVPRAQDKFIKSPYNTYQNIGLPPAPIANPSIDAIIAALNPRETDCLFYYHTDDGTFYCNATYEEHVAGIKQHLK
jgi:cell division protein YceG involved in septum cleavage